MDSTLRQPVLSPFNGFERENVKKEDDYCTDEDEGKQQT